MNQTGSDAEAERLSALRMQMLEMHPFWGYLLLQMRLLPAPRLPTYAATDGVRHIWYNPARTRELCLPELGFVLTHEVCHQVLATTARQDGRETVKWERAADYAINAMVAEIPVPGAAAWAKKLYQMPENGLFNPKYRDWIAEMIYEDLCRKPQDGEAVTVELFLPNVKGEDVAWPGVLDHRGGIDVHLPVAMTANQLDLLRNRLKAAAENFHAHADRGHLPLDILRQAGVLGPSKIPWQRLLHHFAGSALNTDDYSLARPNKRYRAQDMLVPGHYSETVRSIVVALDTSGSMSREEIRQVAGEVRGMVSHAQDITLIVADCAILQVIGMDELEAFLKNGVFGGGGGTDHVCVFEYIARHRLNPTLFIGLSDLHSRFPREKPPYPVLWVAPECHASPPWGKVITV
ncbi:MAG: VWA-like domain-containing protein [Lentisphaeria bacterium]|nr:VWA-like domain-containing protein [Lentisphaeria bacterium]